MAKTFGTGADPKGLVNRGVEGSGAAQIFRPSQAVQDFVTGQRQQGLQKQKQKQAEAKAKAEKQKEIDKYTVDLVAETFMQPDNEAALAMFGEIQNDLANFKRLGINPDTQPEFKEKVYKAKQFNNIIKNQREDYNKALTNLNTIAKDPNYTPEQIDDFVARLQAYTMASPDKRFSIDISTPLKEVPYDYFKDLLSFAGRLSGGQEKFKYTDADGNEIETYGVKPEKIKAAIEGMNKTKWYKTMYGNIKEENPSLSDEEIDVEIQNAVRPYLPSFYGKTPPKEDTKITFGNGKFGNKLFSASLKNVTPTWLVNTFSNIEFQPEFIQKVNQGAGSFKAIDFAYKGAIPESQYKPITIMVVDKKGSKPKTETVKMLPKTIIDSGGGTYYVVAESLRKQPKLSEVKIDPKTKKEYRDIIGYEEKKTDIMTQLTPESKAEFERQFMDGMTLEEFISGQGTSQPTQQSAPKRSTMPKTNNPLTQGVKTR